MQDIDKLTLELFMNKSTYQKYLAQSDPKKAEENKAFKRDLRKYSKDILKMTQDYLYNPDQTQITVEVNEMLDTFGKTWIKYFQIKELENDGANFHKEKDEDILFDESTLFDSRDPLNDFTDMDSTKTEFSSSPVQDPKYSFLNKNIKYSMDYYAKNK
jgi:hypothetical protein